MDIAALLQRLNGTSDTQLPPQMRWNPQTGHYEQSEVGPQLPYGQGNGPAPMRLPQVQRPQAFQAPQGGFPMPQGGGFSGFGGPQGPPQLGGPLARPQSGLWQGNPGQPRMAPLQAAMRRPAPTGPFAGNAQGSVVGDMGPDAGMTQGVNPALLAMAQSPLQELGNFSQVPNIPQMQGGSQLPQQHGNRLTALLRAILPGV